MVKTITEPAHKLKVIREVDVVVVGGGPGGIASAISAARNGAKTVLIERYGHLGGMATGGLVNIIPNLADICGFTASPRKCSNGWINGAVQPTRLKRIGELPINRKWIFIMMPTSAGFTSVMTLMAGQE